MAKKGQAGGWVNGADWNKTLEEYDNWENGYQIQGIAGSCEECHINMMGAENKSEQI